MVLGRNDPQGFEVGVKLVEVTLSHCCAPWMVDPHSSHEWRNMHRSFWQYSPWA